MTANLLNSLTVTSVFYLFLAVIIGDQVTANLLNSLTVTSVFYLFLAVIIGDQVTANLLNSLTVTSMFYLFLAVIIGDQVTANLLNSLTVTRVFYLFQLGIVWIFSILQISISSKHFWNFPEYSNNGEYFPSVFHIFSIVLSTWLRIRCLYNLQRV